MDIRSERSTFALLVGMTVGVLASIFMTPTFWGPILGVFAAATLAEVTLPKDEAIIGAIALIPIGIYITIQTAIQINALQSLGILVTIPFFCIAVLVLTFLGALYGLVIGKLFQITKGKKLMI